MSQKEFFEFELLEVGGKDRKGGTPLVREECDVFANKTERPIAMTIQLYGPQLNPRFRPGQPAGDRTIELPGAGEPLMWPANAASFPPLYLVNDGGRPRCAYYAGKRPPTFVIPPGTRASLPRSMREGIQQTWCIDCVDAFDSTRCVDPHHARQIIGGLGHMLSRLDEAGEPILLPQHPALAPASDLARSNEDLHQRTMRRASGAGR